MQKMQKRNKKSICIRASVRCKELFHKKKDKSCLVQKI